MKIAIANQDKGFAPYWKHYCEENQIDYITVNPYDDDIIEQVRDCNIFLWHHNHGDYRDMLFAKQLLYSLEQAGKVVFPDFHTCWHFDDKVGQKYLLEALDLPLVKSYAFYSKQDALNWIQTTDFPKVFKLRGGAGSSNVRLAKNRREAKRLIAKAFGRGFSQFNRLGYFKDRYQKWKEGKDSFTGVLKGVARIFIPTEFSKLRTNEKGYVYFQDFMPGNDCDTRITVINGTKAYGFRRGVRNHDFRASGSGKISYSDVDPEMVKLAFQTADKIQSSSLAIDFIYDASHNPKIVEISFGFVPTAVDATPGYWTPGLKWIPSQNKVGEEIIKGTIERYKEKYI